MLPKFYQVKKKKKKNILDRVDFLVVFFQGISWLYTLHWRRDHCKVENCLITYLLKKFAIPMRIFSIMNKKLRYIPINFTLQFKAMWNFSCNALPYFRKQDWNIIFSKVFEKYRLLIVISFSWPFKVGFANEMRFLWHQEIKLSLIALLLKERAWQ